MSARSLVFGLLAAMALSHAALAQTYGSGGPPASSPVAAASRAVALGDLPATIAGSGSWTSSGCIGVPLDRAFTLFVALSGAGTIQVQRFNDAACAHPLNTLSFTLTSTGCGAGQTNCGYITSNSGMPFIALKVTITDTSGSTNTVQAASLVLGSE